MSPILSQRSPSTTCCVYIGVYPFSGAYKLYHMSTTMQKNDLGTGDLCDNIGLVGVFAKWSYMYVTSSPCHLDRAIPILSPLLFMHVDHPYIPLFKIRRIFDLLVYISVVWTSIPQLSTRFFLRVISIFPRMATAVHMHSLDRIWASQLRQLIDSDFHSMSLAAAPMLTARFSCLVVQLA